MSALAGWGEPGGPVALSTPLRTRKKCRRRRVDGDAFAGAVLVLANALGLTLAVGTVCDEVHDTTAAASVPDVLPPP